MPGALARRERRVRACGRLTAATLMLDRSRIGFAFPVGVSRVERGRIKLYAQAIGEADPLYRDVAVAHARGYPDIPIPPGFLYSLDLEREPPIDYLEAVGARMGRLLHGEQTLSFFRDICAGTEICFHTRIADIYAKRNGTLEFFLVHTRVTDSDQVLVAELRSTFIVPDAKSC
jgi:hypothetical protein